MTRESVEQKAARYLTEGRVLIAAAGPGYVTAAVRGDGAIHHVGYRRGGWACDCPARGRCCHLLAVRLVTAPTTERYGQPTSITERTAACRPAQRCN